MSAIPRTLEGEEGEAEEEALLSPQSIPTFSRSPETRGSLSSSCAFWDTEGDEKRVYIPITRSPERRREEDDIARVLPKEGRPLFIPVGVGPMEWEKVWDKSGDEAVLSPSSWWEVSGREEESFPPGYSSVLAGGKGRDGEAPVPEDKEDKEESFFTMFLSCENFSSWLKVYLL